MRRTVIKRMLQLIPIIICLTFFTFALMFIAPGDPAKMKLKAQGVPPSVEALEKARTEMGLGRPFLEQYGSWFWNMLHGDFGTSYKFGTPVLGMLTKATGNTFVLGISSILLAVIVSFPLGIYTAVHQNRFSDYLIRACCFLANSMPTFLVALLLMYLLCLRFQLLPVLANGSLRGLILPTVAMSSRMTADFIRQIRAETLEQLSKDYVVGERARGDRESIILYKNVLHNSLITILTVLGLSVAGVMGGSVVVESIFLWPGLGKLVMDAINNRDYPIIQGFVIWMSTIYLVVNLLTDLSYKALDPRIEE